MSWISGQVAKFAAIVAALVGVGAPGRVVAGDAPEPPGVDFRAEVWPIFAERCHDCHGSKLQKGGLRLDRKAEAFQGGGSGSAFEPGKSAESLLIDYVTGVDETMVMPPKGPRLSDSQVSAIRTWIDQGAIWPDDLAGSDNSSKAKSRHWSFQPVHRPPTPPVRNPSWVRGPIDAFILAKLDREGVEPSPEADRSTLIRRLSLDLLGLPPRPADVLDFQNDPRPDAFERLVDRLLASPLFGERWGRHWLDLARYADSDGYEKDSPRPNAWRFRDWVINALNRDLPFDQFTLEQLAGDLMPEADLSTKAATGFHRNTLTNREGGADPEEFRVKAVVDRVNTTGTVWLGLTVGCAQCHSHKYDPIAQKEYYNLFAFFNGQSEEDLPAPLPGEFETHQREKATHEAMLAALAADPAGNADQIKALEKSKPTFPTSRIPALVENPAPPKTHILIRGDFLRKGDEVGPGTPEVLPPIAEGSVGPTRLDLARWLVSGENPLTGRVTVNRVWQRLFGKGLVTTPEDFGTRGEPPSHPELLDWLATEFEVVGWSQKALIRSIVLSATYRQSSVDRPELRDRDPSNAWLARQNRLRLEAEILRDSAMASGGILALKVGGPSVRPPQPAGISELTYAGSAKWVESQGADRHRRGLYTWFQRTSPYPMLLTFDAPDANVCAVRRERSNTPLQALTLLNDATFVESAGALARRVLTEAGSDLEGRIRQAFLICLSRPPTIEEAQTLVELRARLLQECQAHPEDAARLAGEPTGQGESTADRAAWVAIARALLNLDEFVNRE